MVPELLWLAGNIDNTILFIIALVVIFGAVAAAFFIKSRGARRAVTSQSTRQSEPDWKLEAQRYKDELEAMKRNQKQIGILKQYHFFFFLSNFYRLIWLVR